MRQAGCRVPARSMPGTDEFNAARHKEMAAYCGRLVVCTMIEHRRVREWRSAFYCIQEQSFGIHSLDVSHRTARARSLPGTHRDSKRKKVAVAVEAGLQAMHSFSRGKRGRQRHPELWPAPDLAHPQAASGGLYRHRRPTRHKCRHRACHYWTHTQTALYKVLQYTHTHRIGPAVINTHHTAVINTP